MEDKAGGIVTKRMILAEDVRASVRPNSMKRMIFSERSSEGKMVKRIMMEEMERNFVNVASVWI